jgi:hypothetical protein
MFETINWPGAVTALGIMAIVAGAIIIIVWIKGKQ